MMETIRSTAELLQQAEQRIDWVLSHPGMSTWLKDALRTARDRDPVAILNDLAMLYSLLQPRSQALIDRRLADTRHTQRIPNDAGGCCD